MKELKIPAECSVCGMETQIKKVEYECPKCSSSGQVTLDPEGIKSESVFEARTGDCSFGARNCF